LKLDNKQDSVTLQNKVNLNKTTIYSREVSRLETTHFL
jgi:hypothetical protein